LHQTQSRESLQFDQVLSTTQSNNLIFVSVEIADKEYRFLFDTGAPMVISKELQEEFQFKIRTQKQVYDSQNQSQVQNYVTVDSLIIGELLFTDLTAIEADLRYSPILACLNIDGIIGANLMRYAFWEMDAATGYLRMSSSTKHWPLDTSNLISKTFKVKNTYTPVMDLRLGNTLYRNITFDTGSNDLLSLGKTGNANYHADSVLFKAYGILSAGLFGSVVDTVEYQFLDFYLDSLPYRCPIEFESAKDARLLGMSFFSQFRIYMDWTAGKMHFLPHDSLNFSNSKSYPTSPFLKDNAIIISQLNDFTLRDQLNLALGDTIESINGKSIYPATAETYCEVIELFKREEQLTLQIRRKGEMLIRKEDLFTTMNLR
tara:strand:- start:624 stop:1745 length:1122 start_codon:yes stop_codon:yes gene_type:complete